MATNTILTPDVITREALRVFHEVATFLMNINKQYDGTFAKSGAKKGDTVRIRKPAQFKVREGNALTPQDYIEQNVPLTVDTRLGVDLEFSTDDLTLSLDDFSERIIRPAISQLVSSVEERVYTTASGQSVVANATQDSELFKDILLGQAYLDNLTTPRDQKRCVIVDTMTQVGLVDSLKGLFQASDEISKQYKEGIIGRTAGATWFQSSRIPLTTTSPEASFAIVSFGGGDPNIGSASGATMVVTATGAGTISAGQMFELDVGVAVHPETKKAFVGQKVYVTAQSDVVIAGAGNVTVPIAAPIISSNTDARQNISAAPVNATAVAADLPKSLIFHKDFMTFATADLVMPKGVDMASRQVFEGVSMRLVRQYNIQDDTFPVRFDILFGEKVIRPEYCCTLVKTY